MLYEHFTFSVKENWLRFLSFLLTMIKRFFFFCNARRIRLKGLNLTSHHVTFMFAYPLCHFFFFYGYSYFSTLFANPLHGILLDTDIRCVALFHPHILFVTSIRPKNPPFSFKVEFLQVQLYDYRLHWLVSPLLYTSYIA